MENEDFLGDSGDFRNKHWDFTNEHWDRTREIEDLPEDNHIETAAVELVPTDQINISMKMYVTSNKEYARGHD